MPMIPEGLDKQPLKDLVSQLVDNNFNCVRLTYAIYMWTRYSNQNLNNTLHELDVPGVIEGIHKNNPQVLRMNHIQAFEAVVNELGRQNVKVLLDNHVSEPKWCCNDDDENGFFFDRHFDPHEWIHGLSLAAKHFSRNTAVVAQSLRNELHGPRQNEGDWYKYMSKAAMAIHKENPNVLVLISGLNYDTELQFLKNKPLKINLGNKLVYETHLYSWSGIGTLKLKDIWIKQPLNRICALSIRGLDSRAGFLTMGENAAPLIFTEFGFDQTGGSVQDNRFLTCLQTYLAGRDMDWGLWAFQGGYYVRDDDNVQVEETFGVMNSDWNHLRYPNFTDKFQLLQMKIQDPTSKKANANIIYYPLSGQCAKVNHKNELELVTVSDDCENKNKKNNSWRKVSLSKLHLATFDHKSGKTLCLQKDPNSSTIVTSKCICITDDSQCLDDPQSQWFQLVPTNV
ncbi:hypothetical protein PIB30_070415 [Stylosanthes scabra]|uniref:Glycoside hydrolase family 5 domain-containing protein n=2 Tax=Stylosanthes scabra TaxID=79078 RepID=A0ABU6WLV8_9FABA|nr:hypothetical protein [Stylosanthes scabra]